MFIPAGVPIMYEVKAQENRLHVWSKEKEQHKAPAQNSYNWKKVYSWKQGRNDSIFKKATIHKMQYR